MNPNFIPYIFLKYPFRNAAARNTTAGQKIERVIVLFRNGLTDDHFKDITVLEAKLIALREARENPIEDITWQGYTRAVEDYSLFLGYDHNFKSGKRSTVIDIRRANRVLMALYNPHQSLLRWAKLEAALANRQVLLTERLKKSHFDMEQELQVWLMLKLFMLFPNNNTLYNLHWGNSGRNYMSFTGDIFQLNIHVASSDKTVDTELVSLKVPEHLNSFLQAYVDTLEYQQTFWPVKHSIKSLIRGYLAMMCLEESNTILTELKILYLVHKPADILNTGEVANVCVKNVVDFVNNDGYLHLVDNVEAITHFENILPINK